MFLDPQGYGRGYKEGRDPCQGSNRKSKLKHTSSARREPCYKESPDHRRRYCRNPDSLDIADAGYEVDIDLPGFKKDEISIELENGYLTVSAAKGLDKDEEDKKGKYIRKERYAGAMQRSFYVGEYVTQEDIKAKYENGILRLSVPKKEAKPVETKKTIAIEG